MWYRVSGFRERGIGNRIWVYLIRGENCYNHNEGLRAGEAEAAGEENYP